MAKTIWWKTGVSQCIIAVLEKIECVMRTQMPKEKDT